MLLLSEAVCNLGVEKSFIKNDDGGDFYYSFCFQHNYNISTLLEKSAFCVCVRECEFFHVAMHVVLYHKNIDEEKEGSTRWRGRLEGEFWMAEAWCSKRDWRAST